jgi:hypothetical protein
MRALLTILSACLGLAVAAPSQCQFQSVQQQSYGSGCNPVFPTNLPTLASSLDATNCTLTLTVTAFGGCCNTYLQGFVLALGTQQANVPLPMVGQGCTLLVNAVAILFQQNGTYTFTLPPTLPPPFVFFAQPAAIYFTTIGFSHDFSLGAGAQITLQ